MTTDLLASATPTITYAPPEGIFTYIWVLIALPLIGAAVLLSFGRRTDSWGHYLATALPIGSFILAVMMWLGLLARPSEERGIIQHLWDWVFVGSFTANVGLQIDQLSMTFVLLITGVGSLIHIYSIGYMKDDPKRRLFFAYLNLFVAAMLLLVLADNYLLLYVGWEGVGLASYLLIGFWQYKPSAAVAAKKAFVVNRVGDFGLSVAIMAIFVSFGTVTFPEVFAQAGESSEGTLTWIGLLLLLAACGKSAQFPLQSWLLDAMEGPTPVSALIHAATMVTAGVYLIARSNPIFDGAPTAQTVVIFIGAFTLIFGAIIGLAKDEIKKVLAGSTMSQIGYMVLAAGLGPIGYVFAIFHLVNHGFFKANMFLGAGSVMHSFNNQENMRRFGGIRTVMVVTYVTFAAGWLAIMGVPPFSGFYSKDKIIEAGVRAQLGRGSGRHDRRRDHRLLHDPVVHHDVPGQEALDRRRASARVPAGDDHPVDHPGHRVAGQRFPAGLERRYREVAGTGRGLRTPRTTDTHTGDQWVDPRTGHRRCPAGLPAVPPRGSADRPDVGVAADRCGT